MDGVPGPSICALLLAGTAMCVWTGGAGTTAWSTNGNWNAHAPATNEGADFNSNTYREVEISSPVELPVIKFDADAQTYLLRVQTGGSLTLTGAGVINDSTSTQTIHLGAGGQAADVQSPVGQHAQGSVSIISAPPSLRFTGSSSASGGTGKVRYTGAGAIAFADSSSAGNADFQIGSGGSLSFAAGTSAGTATMTIASGATLSMDRVSGGKSIAVQSGGQADITVAAAGNGATGPTLVNDGTTRLHLASGATGGTYAIGAFSGSGSLGLGGVTLDAGSDNSSTSYSGTIAGAGGVTKSGTGTLTLSGANSYSGGTRILDGTIAFGSATAFGSGTISIGDHGAIAATADLTLGNEIQLTAIPTWGDGPAASIGTGGHALILSGGIGGSGDVMVRGGGSVTYTADATNQGLTSVAQGTTLRLGNGGTGGSVSGDMDVAGTLEINLSRAYNYSGYLSGNGAILVGGTGIVTFTGGGDFSGDVTVGTSGTLQLGDGTAGGGAVSGNYTDNGRLIVNLSGTNAFGGIISGSGSVELKAGTTIVTNANSYTGGTTIDADATFQLGDGVHDGSVENGITNNGLLIAKLSGDATSATQVSGTGAFRLSGGHVLILTAASSFTGGTTIDAGSTLKLGAGGMLAGPIAVSGTFAVDRADSVMLTNVLSGAGTFTKLGAGTLTYNGDGSHFTGALNLTQGSFALGDESHGSASLGGAVNVMANTILLGHGTIAGAVTNNGTVRPGGSIGTLTIGSSFSQAAGATLTIDVTPSNASKLAIAGPATLGGTLNLIYAPGTYTAHTYDLLTAAGGVTGTFSAVTGTAPGGSVNQSVAYSANAVRLVLASAVVAPINPAIRTDMSLLLADNGQWDEEQDYARTRAAHRGIWGETRKRWTSLSGSYRSDAWGMAGGVDFDATQALRLGISSSWTETDFRMADGGSGKVDSWRASGLARLAAGPFWFAARAGGAHHRVSATRIASSSAAAAARFNASEFEAAAYAGARLTAAGWTVEPRLGISLRAIDQQRYAETGAGSFDVVVAPVAYQSMRSGAGLNISRSIRFGDQARLTIDADAAWAHEFRDRYGAALATAPDGTLFALAGTAAPRDRLILGLGLNGEVAPGITLFASWRLQPGMDGAEARSVQAGLRIGF